MQLAELAAAIDQQAWPRALELALDAWRITRLPALADLIDLVSARTPGEPIARTDLQIAWIERARSATARDIEPLMASVARGVPVAGSAYLRAARERYARWLDRISALAALPEDPRIARGLFEVIRRAPFASVHEEDAAAIYERVFELLARTADERLIAPMRALAETPVASRQSVRSFFAVALPATCDRIVARRAPANASLAAECDVLIERLGGRVVAAMAEQPTEDEAALFARVLADPADDGPREVLGDYWLERDDPRGHLISLQLRGGDDNDKAARALLREHEKTWLGPLALVTQNRVWRRGFLDECELRNNAAADEKMWDAAATSPLFGTVRVLHKGAGNAAHYTQFVLSPMARALAEVTVLSKAMLRQLCEHTPAPPLARLVLRFAPDKASLALLGRTLPALTAITVPLRDGGADKLTALARQLLAQRKLSAVGAAHDGVQIDARDAARWLRADLGITRELRFAHGSSMSVRTGARGLHVHLDARTMYMAVEILQSLGAIEHLKVTAADGSLYNWPGDEAAAPLLARFSSVELDAAWAARFAKR